MKTRERILCILLLTLAASFPVTGTIKKRGAVMDFTANNTASAYAKIVRNQIEVALYKTGYFEILERDKMDLILKEQGLNVSGCIDTSCAVQIGKLLSVDYVIVGSIDRLGKFLLSIKVMDVQKGVVIYADTEHALTENDIPDAISTIAVKASKMLQSGDAKDLAAEKTEIKKEPVKKEQEKQDEEKNVPAGPYNPYRLPAFGLLGLSASSLGGVYYFNMKVTTLTDDYNSLSSKYKTATTEAEAKSLHSRMSDTKKESDKYLLYRNITYGAGAGFLLIGGYFFYKYIVYVPSAVTGGMDMNKFNVMPLFFTWREPGYRTGRSDGNFIGGGIMVRF